MEKYFEMAKSQDEAVKYWYKSQYNLSDIVLAMTDNGVFEGHKLFGFFSLEAVSAMMNIYKFNFKLVKKQLGINGNYVDRSGDIFAKDYNPNRNPDVLTIKGDEFKERAEKVYWAIIDEFKEVSNKLMEEVKKHKND